MKVRPLFRRFEAYGWETPSREIAQSVGLKPEQIVRLDTNTSPFLPSGELREVAKAIESAGVNEYPDTSYLALREGLSRYTGKGVDRFVVTNGADEGLDIIAKTLIDADDEAIAPTPTYSMFRIVTELMGGRLKTVARRADFSVDVGAIKRAIGPRTKLVFLCNPNNPTASFTPIEDVEALARMGVTVAIDEAYYEFCGKSALDLTDSNDNIVVCRTFSKAFSMAGVRVGYLVASRESVEKLNLSRPPNSVTVLSLLLAESALRHLGEMRANVRRVVGERARVCEAMRGIPGVSPFPSETNFVLFKVSGVDPNRLHDLLMKRGFVLRNLSGVEGVQGCLRCTVAARETNDAFLRALKECVRA